MHCTYEDLPGLIQLMTGDEKHSPSANSTLDVLWVLYDAVLRLTSDSLDDPDRDRMILSKGHGPMALYAVLASKGIIARDQLSAWGQFNSQLGYHPDHLLVPGVEISSGSLGHGLPIAVGMAIGLGLKNNRDSQIYCLIGDAELDEGSNHEAIALAGRRGLEQLTVIVIDNRSASHGWPGGIQQRFSVEGWSSAVVDGRDHQSIYQGLMDKKDRQPHVVVAQVEKKNG